MKEAQEVRLELTGFKDVEESAMEAVQDIIKHSLRKFVEHADGIQMLHVTLKPVHKREKGEIYELHANLKVNGKIYASELNDRNLLAGIDTLMIKIRNELVHAQKKNK